jgi:predicted  nucleic acid-binding Zn-ribbon protein
MGICIHCGTRFPKTKSTRKYCTPRCKTNACLERRPRRIRASDVEALHALLDEDLPSVEALRERLRAIVAPQRPPIQAVAVPRMD